MKIEKDDTERRKENEAQMMIWTNRAEIHAKQYETLLHKLNEVAQEAQQSRAQAEAERKRVAQLEDMLYRSLNNKQTISENHDMKMEPVTIFIFYNFRNHLLLSSKRYSSCRLTDLGSTF